MNQHGDGAKLYTTNLAQTESVLMWQVIPIKNNNNNNNSNNNNNNNNNNNSGENCIMMNFMAYILHRILLG
jgi:hypothetical protein